MATNIDKIRQNLGVYVTCALIGAGVGMFIGLYVESKRRSAEEAMEVIPPVDESEDDEEIVEFTDDSDEEEDDEDDTEYTVDLDGTYEEILQAELDQKIKNGVVVTEDMLGEHVNYVLASKPALADLLEDMDIDPPMSRYQLMDLEEKTDLPEGEFIYVNPSTGRFFRDMGNGLTSLISTQNVFGPSDEAIRDMVIDSAKHAPRDIWGVHDTELDRHFVVTIKPGK